MKANRTMPWPNPVKKRLLLRSRRAKQLLAMYWRSQKDKNNATATNPSSEGPQQGDGPAR